MSSNLSSRDFSVKPISVHPYFDKVQIWLKRPINKATRAQLENSTGSLYVARPEPARFGGGFIQRIQLKQPRAEAVGWAASRSDGYINQLEVAVDYCFDNAFDLDPLAIISTEVSPAVITASVSSSRSSIPIGRGESRETIQSRYDANSRSAPNTILIYKDPFSRISGELNCLHLEWKLIGGRAVRSAGIQKPSDLTNFDHVAFWRRRLQLFEIDPTRLGRLLFRRGMRFYKSPTIRSVTTGELVSAEYYQRRLGLTITHAYPTIQELVHKYRAYPVRRILTPLSTEAWLPKYENFVGRLNYFVGGRTGYRRNFDLSAYIRDKETA